MNTVTSAEAHRAIYIDFECLQTTPHPTPEVLGVLGPAAFDTAQAREAGRYGSGTPEFEQLLVDPRLAPARVANRRCRVVDAATAVLQLVERAESEGRLIVGWSFFDREVAKRANPALAGRIDALYRNAIQTARPWRQWIHPTFRIQREDQYAPKHTLDKYAVLAGYAEARLLIDAEPAQWIRRALEQLARRGRYRAITAQAKRDWHKLLEYNRHDCLALRHITLKASRELEAWRSYKKAQFCIDDGATRVCFHAGSRSRRVDALLERHRTRRWAFITAWNPASVLLDRTENDRRQQRLREDLEGYRILPGEGIGEDSSWDPEESLMVLGISRGKAVALGSKYGQLAIVVGTRDSPAELISCAVTPTSRA